MHAAHAAIRALRASSDSQSLPRILVVAAHPDDEVIGLGGSLRTLAAATHITYVSDGAPDDAALYGAIGFACRPDYAAARRREARAALSLAGFSLERLHELGAVDQRVSDCLVTLAERVSELIASIAPDAVITHPYEGGHPDHDATAFVVHVAIERLARAGRRAPAIVEFASYHERDGALVRGEFLPSAEHPVRTVTLAPEEQELKRRMFACHATQEAVLGHFRVEAEPFRRAPRYDFGREPLAPFHYDRHGWRCTGRAFLERTRAALRELGVAAPC